VSSPASRVLSGRLPSRIGTASRGSAWRVAGQLSARGVFRSAWANNVSLRLPATCPGPGVSPILPGMFVVSEEAAAAIRTAFDHGGELSAAIELRRLFPGIIDNAKARDCARAIAGWTPSARAPGQDASAAAWQGAVARSASGFGDCPCGLPTTAFPEPLVAGSFG
jgi:hypothetical protein